MYSPEFLKAQNLWYVIYGKKAVELQKQGLKKHKVVYTDYANIKKDGIDSKAEFVFIDFSSLKHFSKKKAFVEILKLSKKLKDKVLIVYEIDSKKDKVVLECTSYWLEEIKQNSRKTLLPV